MSLFELALRARIPIIGIETSDIVNVKSVLQVLSRKKVMQLPATSTNDCERRF
jgi:hypothetical protein